MGKGVIKKHSSKEIQAKIDSHKDKAGGAAGKERRKPKCNLTCKVCKAEVPNIAVLGEHYTAKHPKMPFNAAEYEEKSDT
jgi:hypothetical protein